MLVAEPSSTRLSQHYHCLDLLQATFEDPAHPNLPNTVAATLLEVWGTGGLLQIDFVVPQGCGVSLLSPGHTDVLGRVSSCVKDEYAVLVEFAVEPGQAWFPVAYRPSYLLPAKPAA